MLGHHINVCICTYKRPELLRHLLVELGKQDTNGLFAFSIVVVDNDRERSAEMTVTRFAAGSSIPAKYCVEPQQNIALARNRAIENCDGDYLAFIDDDEFPAPLWLVTLFKALQQHGVDGVLGPVKPHFDEQAPRWVVQGKFYDRPSYPTGFVIDWKKGRTGNVLLKMEVLRLAGERFRPQFRTGEDQDLFRRLIEKGHVFIWCAEAMAYETVPPVRWKRTFLLRRALLRGAVSLRHPTFGAREVLNSVIAVPTYTAALPFALALGQGAFMLLLVKLFDHLGRLLALVGVNPVREQYVTE
ncbi:MAG TPA: glycosyltransferase family 2 protein [Bryobacteraceae bacterium]|nr:glycosyltransferase family 2 protein [Bryobacteraceae bacterium]